MVKENLQVFQEIKLAPGLKGGVNDFRRDPYACLCHGHEFLQGQRKCRLLPIHGCFGCAHAYPTGRVVYRDSLRLAEYVCIILSTANSQRPLISLLFLDGGR